MEDSCLLAKPVNLVNCVMTDIAPAPIIMIVGDPEVHDMHFLCFKAGETISVELIV